MPLRETTQFREEKEGDLEMVLIIEGEEMQLKNKGGIMGSRKSPPYGEDWEGWGRIGVYSRVNVSEIDIEWEGKIWCWRWNCLNIWERWIKEGC